MAEARCEFKRNKFKKVKESLQAILEHFGMEGMKTHIEQSLEEWKDVPLHIGVAGMSGVGKSTFINVVRGLTAEDDGAAAIGVIETTMTVQHYPHPDNNQLVFCDLPGIGTKTFPKETYFTDGRVEFDKFDLFLILTANRFTENDLWLARFIKERNKGFIFIRTKIDHNVADERSARKKLYRSHPEAIKDAITKIRVECETNLGEFFVARTGTKRVFLIGSHDCENPLYDFDSLTKQLIENFNSIKRDAFILSVTAMTPHIIEAKKEVLSGRFWKVCVLSALGALVSIPSLSVAINAEPVLKEAVLYRDQLGLEVGKLKVVASLIDKPWKDFKADTDLRSMAFQYTTDGILQKYSTVDVSEALTPFGQKVYLFFGTILVPIVTYIHTECSLESILDMMVNDAKKLNKYLAEQSMSTSLI